MENIIIDNISLMLLIPLWIFLIIMCGRFFSVYVNEKIIYLLTLVSSLFGIFTSLVSIAHLKTVVEWVQPFIKIGNYTIDIGLRVDKISLILASILFIISFAVQLYSIHNLKDEKKKYRFWALLNMFNFGMGSVLLSPNLIQMYVFWEITGIISYLLIGFDYSNPVKSEASKRVFIINRIGDTALIGGILLVQYFMYSYAHNYNFVTLALDDMNAISTLTLAYAPYEAFVGICLLFILAAAVKSAQFPFYTWLQDAMEARIPVSALLHSATLVVLGVYLIIRLMPFFTLNNHLLEIILILGILTAIVCSILASIEVHTKKILAYSTSANLGLMFAALGLENIKAAIILLGVHAFVKSMLFILIPENKKISYTSSILMIIGAFSLAGLLLSGVGAKEILYTTFGTNKILDYTFLFVTFVSAYYITRFVFIAIKECEYKKIFGLTDISGLVLISMNIVLYVFLRGTYNLSEPIAASIGGTLLAILFYKKCLLEKLSTTPKIAEKLNNKIVPKIFEYTANGLNIIEGKLFVNYKLILHISKLCVKTSNWIEENIMDNAVNITSDTAKLLSETDKRLQGGNIQNYNAYGFIIITAIITLVIISYTFIIGQIE